MDKKMLQNTFREFKRKAAYAGFKVDYAITNPDGLGDCQSCVNYALCEKYGEESKGVWVKEWTRGMNAGRGIEKCNSVYVAHDLDDVQVSIFYTVVGENYNILPKKEDFDKSLCFSLYEKDVDIYSVSYTTVKRRDKPYKDAFIGKDAAMSFVSELLDHTDYVVSVSIDKEF